MSQPVPIFFIVLAIILLAPILFNRLKVPHIIGLILAGVVIGPYGLNVLDRDSSFAIFGQVGLLYLMFLAGLEIDMFHLRLNLRRGLAFGLLTLLIPLAAGVLTSVYLLHLGWLTSMLLGAMYASHTLLAYPVAARYGITRSPAVLISVVGTIIAVLGGLVVLAVVGGAHRDGSVAVGSLVRLTVLTLAYCAAVIYVYPWLTRWFFRTYSDRVMRYVFVLALVFLAAWTAQMIGLEAVLGAFLAGLVLNRYVPASSPLMGSIEFVGNALFIPYFLISVGMIVNLRVVFNGATLAVAGIMLAVAIVSKWLPAWIAQRLDGMTGAERGVMFGLTSAHTAVALAVVTLGQTMGMFDDRVLNATLLVILITCAVAPIVTGIYAPRVKLHLLRLADEQGEEGLTSGANTARRRLNNTLIPVATARSAPELVELAALMRNTAGRNNFYALHVRSDNSAAARSQSDGALRAACETASAANIDMTTLDRYDLNVATGVLNAINERNITEVILGLHRRQSFIDTFFGAKVEQLLHDTNRMIVISRCFAPLSTMRRIVVYSPPKAQYETGFTRWVRMASRLGRQLGCRMIFCCPDDQQPLIRGVLYQNAAHDVRCEFRTADAWDDFIVLSPRVLPDDLLIVIGARQASVSFNLAMLDMPGFIQRYFTRNNVLVVYPEQFGTDHEGPLVSYADPLATDFTTRAPAPLARKFWAALHWRKSGKHTTPEL